MSSVILSLAFSSPVQTAIAQDAAKPKAATTMTPDREKVLATIDLLQSRSFKVRQDAEQALWKMGPAILPILIEDLDSADPETRGRIQSLQSKFELGLTPDMPARVRRLIVVALSSKNDTLRRESTATLAREGHFAAVIAVVKRISSARERGEFFSLIVSATRARPVSDALDDFQFDLLRIAVSEKNQEDRTRLTQYVLRDNRLRKRAATTQWIEKLIKFIPECPDIDARRNLIDGIYFDSSTVLKLTTSDVLVQWINLVSIESDRAIRYRHVAKLLKSSTLIRSYPYGAANQNFKIEAVFKKLTPAGRNALVDTASTVPAALAALHRHVGDEPLLKAAAQTKEAAIRGNLTGRIASLETWPADKTKKHDVLSLINSEPAGAAREQAVIGYLQGLSKRTRSQWLPPKETANEIWMMLNTESEEAWQLNALLETYGSPRVFARLHTAATIDRIFRLVPTCDDEAARLFAYAPINRPYLTTELGKHRRALAYLKAMNELPDTSMITGRFSSLLGSTTFTDAIRDAKERTDLLRFCREEIEGRAKYYAANGMVRNTKLLTEFFDEGEFENVKKTLIDGMTGASRAEMLGKFLANESTIAHLVKAKRVQELLAFKQDDLPDKGRESILLQLVVSDTAVSALLDAGHYDKLLASIEEVKNDSQRQNLLQSLSSRSAYARVLARRGELGKKILEMSKNRTWMSQRSYVNLIRNLTTQDVAKEPKLALELSDFAIKLPREYDRRECVRALFASQWYVPQLRANNKLQQISVAISNAIQPSNYRSMLQTVLRTENAMAFMEGDRLNELGVILQPLQPIDRYNTFRYFAQTSYMRKWFESDDQPSKLIKQFDNVRSDEHRILFATGFLASGVISSNRDAKEHAPKWIAFAEKQPKQHALRLAIIMMGHYSTASATAKSDLAQNIVDSIEQIVADTDLLREVLKSSSVSKVLKEHGKERELVDHVLSQKDAEVRAGYLTTVMRNHYLREALSDKEFSDAFERLLAAKHPEQHATTLLGSSRVVSRLVELGHFEKVRTLVESKKLSASSKASLQWSFYTNHEVAERLSSQGVKADALLKLLSEANGSYIYSRTMQLANNADALRWFLNSHGWKPIREVIDRCNDRDRKRMLQYMVANPHLIQELAKLDQIDELLKLVDMKEPTFRTPLYYTLTNPQLHAAMVGSERYFQFVKTVIESETDDRRKRMLMSNVRRPSFQSAAIASGEGKWLVETLMDSPEATDPVKLRESIRSSGSLLHLAIRVGRIDLAQELLVRIATDDVGKLRLIRFGLRRAMFDDTYDLSSLSAGPLANDARFQFYLSRAMGKPTKTDDAGLRWAYLMEQHQWDTLRTMTVCRSKELPMPRTTNEINPLHRRVEELAFKIAFAQATAKQDTAISNPNETKDKNNSTADIRLLEAWVKQHATNIPNVRYGCEALLALDEADSALQLMDQYLPRTAFYLHWERLDYDRALQVAGWQTGKPDMLFDDIFARQKTKEAGLSKARGYMLQIALLLRDAGRIDDMHDLLNSLSRQSTRKGLIGKARTDYLTELAWTLYLMNFKQQSHEVAIELIQNDEPPSRYFSRAYYDELNRGADREASDLWNTFKTMFPAESLMQRLERIDGAMTATTPIEEMRPVLDAKVSHTTQTGLPVTRYRYGLYREARRVLESTKTLSRENYILIGRTHMAEDNFGAAAGAFHKAWTMQPTDLTRLYLAGHCLEKAGDAETGSRHKRTARMLAVPMSTTYGFASGLKTEGLVGDAMETYRTLRKSSPPGYSLYLASLYQLAVASDDAAESMELRREHLFSHLRPIRNLSDPKAWIRAATNSRAFQAEAALDAGKFGSVQRHWNQTTNLNFGSTWVAESLVPRLRDQQQPELASHIFEAHEDYLQRRLKEFPDSPMLKKHLRSLREKCSRDRVAGAAE